MSVQSEINRIAGAKSDIATAITNKGVTVPSGTKLDGMAALIGSIESGGSGGKFSIRVMNTATLSVMVIGPVGGSKEIKHGKTASFYNLSNDSEIIIERVIYDSPTQFFFSNGYIDYGEFPDEAYKGAIMIAAEEFMNAMVGDICDSYAFTRPDTIEICFDESSGKPAIIIR